MAEEGNTPVVFSGSRSDNTVRVWRVTAERRVGQPLLGHKKGVTCVAVVDHQRRIMVASASEDKSVQVSLSGQLAPYVVYIKI
jgi:WD40 repeat protein